MIYAKVSPGYLKKASEDLNCGPMPVGKKQKNNVWSVTKALQQIANPVLAWKLIVF